MKRSFISTMVLTTSLLVSSVSAQAPNPAPADPIFSDEAGTYRGLFYESPEARHETAGLLQVTVGSQGGYSARIVFAAHPRSFTGKFVDDGTATKQVRFPGGTLLDITMAIDADHDQITGTVTDGEFTANLIADRTVRADSLPASPAGRYTFLVSPDDVSGEGPSGFGFGVVRVGPAGGIFLNGLLADGTRITQVVALTGDQVWPFYVPLYGRRGSVFGWVNFGVNPTNDFEGLVQWTRPVLKRGRYPAAGWTTQNLLQGSRYTMPMTTDIRVLDFTDGLVQFTGDDLAAPIVNEVTLLPRARVVNESDNRLIMNFNLPWGRFVGWVVDPGTGQRRHFRGGVLQKANIGGGFFYGDTETGRLEFIAKPPPPSTGE